MPSARRLCAVGDSASLDAVDEEVCVAGTIEVSGRGVANLHDVIAEGSTVHDRRRQLNDHVYGVPTGLASEVCVRWVNIKCVAFIPQRHKISGRHLPGFPNRAIREPTSVRGHLDHRQLVIVEGAAVRVLHKQQRRLITSRFAVTVAIGAAAG